MQLVTTLQRKENQFIWLNWEATPLLIPLLIESSSEQAVSFKIQIDAVFSWK